MILLIDLKIKHLLSWILPGVIVFLNFYRYQLLWHLLSATSMESSVDWWRLPLRGIWKEWVGQSLPLCGWSWDSSGLGTKSMGWTIFHQMVSYKLNEQYHFYICILQDKVKILLFIIYDTINWLLPFWFSLSHNILTYIHVFLIGNLLLVSFLGGFFFFFNR